MTDDSYFCIRLDQLCALKRNIFNERSISKKQLLLKIIKKIGCSKSVRVIYIIYIIVFSRTDFDERPFIKNVSFKCTKSIQPRTEVRIVGHSVLD